MCDPMGGKKKKNMVIKLAVQPEKLTQIFSLLHKIVTFGCFTGTYSI